MHLRQSRVHFQYNLIEEIINVYNRLLFKFALNGAVSHLLTFVV